MRRTVEVIKVTGRKETKYTPESIARAWKKYKKIQDEHTEPTVSAGIIIQLPAPLIYTEFSFISFLKISRRTWNNYKERKSFVYIVEEIQHEIEDRKEFFYVNGKGSTRALERDLRLHYGWTDPLPSALPVNPLNLSVLSDMELNQAIALQQKLLSNGNT